MELMGFIRFWFVELVTCRLVGLILIELIIMIIIDHVLISLRLMWFFEPSVIIH